MISRRNLFAIVAGSLAHLALAKTEELPDDIFERKPLELPIGEWKQFTSRSEFAESRWCSEEPDKDSTWTVVNDLVIESTQSVKRLDGGYYEAGPVTDINGRVDRRFVAHTQPGHVTHYTVDPKNMMPVYPLIVIHIPYKMKNTVDIVATLRMTNVRFLPLDSPDDTHVRFTADSYWYWLEKP